MRRVTSHFTQLIEMSARACVNELFNHIKLGWEIFEKLREEAACLLGRAGCHFPRGSADLIRRGINKKFEFKVPLQWQN
jgi:hypothetical protein